MQTTPPCTGIVRYPAWRTMLRLGRHLGRAGLSLLAGGLLLVSSFGAQAQSIDGRFWSGEFILQSRSVLTGATTAPASLPRYIGAIGRISELGGPSYDERRWYYSSPRSPLTLDLATSGSRTNVEIGNLQGNATGTFHFKPGLAPYGESVVQSAATTLFDVTLMRRSVLTASMRVDVSLAADLPAGAAFQTGDQLMLSLKNGATGEWEGDQLEVLTDAGESIEQSKMLSVSWENTTDEPVTLTLDTWQSIYANARLLVLSAAPELSAATLLLAGLAVLAWVRFGRRRRRAVSVSPPDGRRWRVWRAPGFVLLGGTACFANAQGIDFHATLLPPSAQYAAPADGRIVTVEGEWRDVISRLHYSGACDPCTPAIDSYDASLDTPHTQYGQFGTSWAKNVLEAPDSAFEATMHFEPDDAVETYDSIGQSFDMTMQFHLPDAASTFTLTLPVTFDVWPQDLDGLNYFTSVSLHLMYFGSSEAGMNMDFYFYSGAGPAHFDRELTLSSPQGGDIDVQVSAYFQHIYVPVPVPEPGEFAMLSSGLLALAAVRRVRRRYRNEGRVRTMVPEVPEPPM